MRNTLKSVVVKSYPVLHLEFEDGFSGDLDLTETISRGNMFEPLKQRIFFEKVKVDQDGYSFGWRLDDVGNELDFSAEGARIDIETAIAQQLANTFQSKIQAAE